MRLWCDTKVLFSNYLRLSSLPDNRRSDADGLYLQELSQALESRLVRRVANLPVVTELLALNERFPNFARPLRFIAEQVAIAKLRGQGELRLPPMLFVGPPGVGKTHFAQALAEVLGSMVETVNLSSASGGFMLSGLDRGWNSARVGRVYAAIAWGESLAPVIVLDELDKANNDARSDPVGPLYQLLEPRTAQAFRDEYVDFVIDASQVAWIATANDSGGIPPALLSRFRVFDIAAPDDEQLGKIAQGIYRELAAGLPGVPPTLPARWLRQLAGSSVREVRLRLEESIGRAALRAAVAGEGKLRLLDADIDGVGVVRTGRRMGFIGGR